MIISTYKIWVVIISAGYTLPTKARFDVVAVTATRDKAQIEIIKNAFELAY